MSINIRLLFILIHNQLNLKYFFYFLAPWEMELVSQQANVPTKAVAQVEIVLQGMKKLFPFNIKY